MAGISAERQFDVDIHFRFVADFCSGTGSNATQPQLDQFFVQRNDGKLWRKVLGLSSRDGPAF